MWIYKALLWFGCGVMGYAWVTEPTEQLGTIAMLWVGYNVLYVGLMLAQWAGAINRQLAALNFRLLGKR
jgi:hypothetical protein